MLPKQENLPLARQLAVQALLRSDLRERAARSGGRFEIGPEGQKRIGLRYLGRELFLSFPRGTIEPSNGGGPVSLREEILILHYLEKAPGIPLPGNGSLLPRSREELFTTLSSCSVARLPWSDISGKPPRDCYLWLSDEVRGEPWSMGDVGVKIQAFPCVALGLVLWKGDAEFPQKGMFFSTPP